MIIQLLNKNAKFVYNIANIVIPDEPVIPDVPIVEIPVEYTNFAHTRSRNNLSAEQKQAVAEYLYKLNQAGILGKIRQLYMPCIAQDWAATSFNVARYFNEGVEENIPFGLVSNSTLGQCFQVCDYGIYKTSDQIKWGDCLTTNWKDEDVTMNNMHALIFKPGPYDCSTNVGNGGFNLRSRTSASQKFQFGISSATSTTQRVRGGFSSGSIHIDGVQTDMKGKIFTEPTGWGIATHDPYCVGISIINNQMITPSSSYDAFLKQSRALVNEITTWELTGQYELPTTSLTGEYSWGGYYGQTVSMQ